MPFEVIEHTADLKIKVRAASLENLFSEAVLAMMAMIKTKATGVPAEAQKVKIEAPDETALLIDFLSEVLALSQTNKEVYHQVAFTMFSPTTLEAVLEGVKVDNFDKDIKAVTYHEAQVRQKEEGEWETLLVFDI